MRLLIALLGLAAWAFQAADPPQAVVQDLTQESQTFGATRSFQAVLPPTYAASKKRYPVIYWFQGYEQSSPQRDAEINQYVATHDLLLVRIGPVETVGAFPLYFPELVAHVDKTLRTVPDRDHRAVTGFSVGGYMAFWTAGKYPDLVASASNFMGYSEASVGPANLDIENRLDDLYLNYEGVRTRFITGTRDFLRFYQSRLNAAWLPALSGYQTESFDSEHAAPAIAKTLDFHMQCFAAPQPKPAVFHHADPYPNFSVWGWEVFSERRQPGFTVLENVSAKGFRSAVREWVPGGAPMPEVRLSVTSPPRAYLPGSPHSVTYIRLRDGNVRKAAQKADAQGRLAFEVPGEPYEVGVAAEPLLALTGVEVVDAAWATAGQPVKLRLKIWNKGGTRSGTSTLQWESPTPGVQFDPPASRFFGLGPGESAAVPLTVAAPADGRAALRIVAVEGANRMSFVLPLFPAAEPAANFVIADGQTVDAWRRATQHAEEPYGSGNADGHAAPGENFVVFLPDGEFLRAAELFTSDACVENTGRGSDSWLDYDRAAANLYYSMPSIKEDCPPGHVVRMLARILVPNAPDHQVRYAAIEFPVWYRRGEEPKKP